MEGENDNNRLIKKINYSVHFIQLVRGKENWMLSSPAILSSCALCGKWKENQKKRRKDNRGECQRGQEIEEVSDMNKMVAKATVFRLFLSLWRCTEMQLFFFFFDSHFLSLCMSIDITVIPSHQTDTLSALKAREAGNKQEEKGSLRQFSLLQTQ